MDDLDDFAPDAAPEGLPAGEVAVLPSDSVNSVADGQNTMHVQIGSSNSRHTNVANVLNQFYDGSGESLGFSGDMVASLPEPVEDELRELVFADDAWVEKLLAHLEEKRLLLLTGHRGSGKRTMAKYLATRLAERRSLRGRTQVVGPLQTRVRILVRKVAAEQLIAGNRIAVFLDVLASRNTDLMTLFTADRSAWEQLSATLRANDTYWIFTSSELELRSVCGRRTDHLVRHDMPPFASRAIETAVGRKLDRLERERPACADRIQLLRSNGERLARDIRSLPNAISFVEDFLRCEHSIDLALERFGRRSSSFLSELTEDPDAWCAAFTLALCDAVPGEPVAWSDFDRFRRTVTERIKNDPEIFPRRRTRPDEIPAPAAAATLTDDLLMERCRMRVSRDSTGLRDVVSFDHDSRSAEIWDALLHRHRRVLALIMPVVRSMAESEEWPIRMRIRAAQILGRIGAIDASAFTLPLIERDWPDAGDVVLQPLIGRVVEGVIAGGDERQQSACLEALEDLASCDGDGELDDAARNRLGAAIAAYSQLGGYASARAMDHLGAIARDHCAPSVKVAHDFFIRAERAERNRSNTRSKRRAEMLRRSRNGLGHEARRRLAQEAPLLFALEQAVVYLCFENDPVRTLDATRDWISKGGAPTATLMMLLFLRNGGIADRLEDLAISLETEHGTATINPLILSAAQSRAATLSLCAFLADLYAAINSTFALPVLLQRDFRGRFEACLTMWVRGAIAVPDFGDAVEELFAVLANARGGMMRRDLYNLIGTGAFTESEKLAAFAANVRRRLGG